jgi:hypothetical protein
MVIKMANHVLGISKIKIINKYLRAKNKFLEKTLI